MRSVWCLCGFLPWLFGGCGQSKDDMYEDFGCGCGKYNDERYDDIKNSNVTQKFPGTKLIVTNAMKIKYGEYNGTKSVRSIDNHDLEGLRFSAIEFGKTPKCCEYTKTVDAYSPYLYEKEWILDWEEVENIVYLEELAKDSNLYSVDLWQTAENSKTDTGKDSNLYTFNVNVLIALQELKAHFGFKNEGYEIFQDVEKVESFRVINDAMNCVVRKQLNSVRLLNFFPYYYGFFFLIYLWNYLAGSMSTIGAISMSLVMGWTLPEVINSVIDIKKIYLCTGNLVEFWRRGLSTTAGNAAAQESCAKIPYVFMNVFLDFGDCTCFWLWGALEIYSNIKAKAQNDFTALDAHIGSSKLIEVFFLFCCYFFLKFKTHHVGRSLNAFTLALYQRIEVGRRVAFLKMWGKQRHEVCYGIYNDYARPFERVRFFLRTFVGGSVIWDNQFEGTSQKGWFTNCVLNPLFALRAMLQFLTQMINAQQKTDYTEHGSGIHGRALWPYDLYIVICTMVLAFAQVSNAIMVLNTLQTFFRRTDALAAKEYYQAVLEQEDLSYHDLEILQKNEICLKTTFFSKAHMKKVYQYEMRQYNTDTTQKWVRKGPSDCVTGRAIWKQRFGNHSSVSQEDAEWLFGACTSTVAILERRRITEEFSENKNVAVLSVLDIGWLKERLDTASLVIGMQRQDS